MHSNQQMNTIEEIKSQLARRAVILTTGGFKPTNSDSESWIGRVYLYNEDEDVPRDNNGNIMIPLFQLCMNSLPFIPETLVDIKALTVFISEDIPVNLTPNGENWVIREYRKTDSLVVKEFLNKESILKAFPLKPEIINEDYPVWDGGGMNDEIADKILKLEKSGEIKSYYDIAENIYAHKVGGYPSFCQPGIEPGEDFQFVFQIVTDEKANLNIIDNGTIFFFKNFKTGEWKYYCDFY